MILGKTMYINFIEDRKNLGFSCIENINSIEQLLSFTNTLKNPVTWIIRKGKQTVILIFSKEVLVTVLIFVESIYLKPIIDCPSFLSSEVQQSFTCISRSDNVEIQISLESTSPSVNSLLGIEGLKNYDQESLTESQSVNSIQFKTGSEAMVTINNQGNQKNGEIPVKSVS